MGKVKHLPPDLRAMTNEEITVAIFDIYDHLTSLTKIILDDKKAKVDSPNPDLKINELAKLRANLKDFRPYG